MPYFSNMPTFDYPLVVNGKTKFVNSRNILVRARIIDYIKDTQASYLNYTILDGERPETLSHRVYGQSELHWIILLFNEIIDPLFEWPLSTNDLDMVVSKKHQGKALFIDLKRVSFELNGIVSKGNEDIWYEVGSTVKQGNAVGKILSWDPNLYKLVIEQTSTTPFFPTVGVGDPTSTYKDLVHVRSDGAILRAPIGRVVDENKYAAHHFENSETGERADHHTKLITSSGEVINASLLDRYVIGNAEIIPTPAGDITMVSNYAHETAENDKKRNIKMMRPELIDSVIKDMRKVFGG